MTGVGRCRLSASPLTQVLDLGRQPLGNGFLKLDEFGSEYFFDLRCGFVEDSKLFQLIEQPQPELMFHQNYAFFSGTSSYMANHFKTFADEVFAAGFVSENQPLVVELGSNDGIYLRHFAERGVPHLGVEPSGAVADVAEAAGISVVREFFDQSLAASILEKRGSADVISAANVMCHIPDIHELAKGIELLLKPDGVLIFEDPYLGDVIKLGSYDQIYDEHVFLFSALSVQEIFATVGMQLIDAQHQVTHGGSMRYTLTKRAGSREVSSRVTEVLIAERSQGLDRTETFVTFAERVTKSGRALRELLQSLKDDGQDVVAYGATSKSTTVYNYAGIGPDLISRVYDNTPTKQGKFTPGSHIPVIGESRFLEDAPTVAFLSAWNHEREIRARNEAFDARGGRWITHVPQVQFL